MKRVHENNLKFGLTLIKEIENIRICNVEKWENADGKMCSKVKYEFDDNLGGKVFEINTASKNRELADLTEEEFKLAKAKRKQLLEEYFNSIKKAGEDNESSI